MVYSSNADRIIKWEYAFTSTSPIIKLKASLHDSPCLQARGQGKANQARGVTSIDYSGHYGTHY